MHRINRFPRSLWLVSLSLALAVSTPPLLSWFLPMNQSAQALSVEELRRNWERTWRKLFETQPPAAPVPQTPSTPPVPQTPSAPPVPRTNPVPPVPPRNGGGCCR